MFNKDIPSDNELMRPADLHTNIQVVKMELIEILVIKTDPLKKCFSYRKKQPIHSNNFSIIFIPRKNAEVKFLSSFEFMDYSPA